ncbi:MAG: 2-dehydropantoate 2-reductase [Proteobacteria bacterium]|nr:2-dehydropantoate 2-reductase [Pseudomonadota bacterium]MBU1716869.1 2-dehydropantoate 2-reductase [Pseudomonadota bacterium]
MRIVVIGPGALGTLLAVSLTRDTSHEIWLMDHNQHRAEELGQNGLILEKGTEKFHYPIKVTTKAREIRPADLILLCVKSQDVAEGLQSISSALHDKSLLISFQNGISHLNILQENTLPCQTAIGVTSLGANLVKPGHVKYGGYGLTKIGFAQPGNLADQTLEIAASLFNSSGLDTIVVSDIINHVWSKLLINVGINALTAIHDCPNGQLLELPKAREHLRGAVKEAAAVARALEIKIDHDPIVRCMEVCRATEQNISSMLQDVRRKRPTEIDAINGAIIETASRLGIPAPINRELVGKIKRIEQKYLV